MSTSASTASTKVELKGQLEIAKNEYQQACDTKAANYDRCQQEMTRRMTPLVAARNQALPQLVGNQNDTSRQVWQASVRDIAAEYERCQHETARLALVEVEACAKAARKVLDLEEQIDKKNQELKNWHAWSDEELITRFESGDIDYSHFMTKSGEHARNVDKLVSAYKTTQRDLFAPTRDVVRRVAYEVNFQVCKTPLNSIHWPRYRAEAGSNSDVTLAEETAPAKFDPQTIPGTSVGPGMFMSRKLVSDKDIESDMRTRLSDPKEFNVASWLQPTPELAIEATIMRPYGASRHL
ncbi:uncharacterized protein LY89DRAFT_178610 [Mollisia scopiformis]|uniref:Uncharacterized protein n=1 Tax=Mollisia scopiformis TaxID=149040 RepID=A0A194XTD3_MOLSC|nr:uncharacterized protein LY89DRAFT_178610 [Mollisia scopiformis]KUJ23309.1 hypothetical protein LY89DRAFT_178610 [Mollisia scopiformis]